MTDAATGAELRDVAVHRAVTDWALHRPTVELPRAETLVAHGDSPLALEPEAEPSNRRASRDFRSDLVVVAAGYALAPVQLALGEGGTFEVALTRASALDVTIAGVPEGDDVELQLHRLAELPADVADRSPDPALPLDLPYASALLRWRPLHRVELPAALRPAPGAGPWRRSVEQLPSGDWAVTLVRRVGEVRFCHAVARVAIAEGQRADLPLAWQPRDEPRQVPLSATLVVPEAWRSLPPSGPLVARLELEQIDPELGCDHHIASAVERPLVAGDDPLRLSFDFGMQWRGVYELTFPRFGFVVHALVRGDRKRPAELRLPEPAEVELTLLPPQGDRPIDCAEVRWIAGATPWARPRSRVLARVDADAGRFRFHAPVGPLGIAVRVAGERVDSSSAKFVVAHGLNRFEHRLSPRSIELVVTLRDGDAVVPWSRSCRAVVERDGQPLSLGFSFWLSGSAIQLQVPGPGRYRVGASDVPGYHDVEPIDVDVAAGRANAVTLPLKRCR